MLVLALDTSTPAVTAGVVALRPAPEVTASRVTVDSRAHGELLTPHVLEVLSQAGARSRDLDAIVCGTGPGPYTGLRAGMVTAAALAHSLDIPAYPVCGLDGIAAEVDTGAPFLVLTDARRREVYWARYDDGGLRAIGPHVDQPADVATDGVARAAGHGAELYATLLGEQRVTPIDPGYPTPLGLVRVAAEMITAGSEPGPLSPLYLRTPHAKRPAGRKRVSS